MSNVAVESVDASKPRVRDYLAAWLIDASFQFGALGVLDQLDRFPASEATRDYLSELRAEIEREAAAGWAGFEGFCLLELALDPEPLVARHDPRALEWIARLRLLPVDQGLADRACRRLIAYWNGNEPEEE